MSDGGDPDLRASRFWCVEWHEEIDSTMVRAREVADDGSPPGTVVVTDFQTAGRGTQGRSWDAPAGSCLMFTVVLDPARVKLLQGVPVEVGEALADLLRREFALDIEVKPPNDLLVDGRKICGILCNSRIRGGRVEQVLCGIGLNTWMTAEQAPIGHATSFVMEGCNPPRHEELLEMIFGELERFVWPVEAESDGPS